MDAEEAIIRERITTSEANYKRLLKICMAMVSEKTPSLETVASSSQALNIELDSYEMMLNQLQLQLNMNEKEIHKYEEQKNEGNATILELTQKSVELQDKLANAQVIRAQKEECSAMVDEMVKPKKVMLDEGDRKVPIIALLNSSRAEDQKLNESLSEEINELEVQKAKYQAVWDSRRAQFDQFSNSVDEFAESFLKRVRAGADRDGDSSREATPFEGEGEVDDDDTDHNVDNATENYDSVAGTPVPPQTPREQSAAPVVNTDSKEAEAEDVEMAY
ncbi:hypothetical protein AWJ20_2677 [Sugiyamaella lignohabitans]|uniref:Tho complex subunit 7 n=1 Tax=Sugiyamaella lignohabitans TaxID=796027 RepID=A0A161HMM1_9ASCO|nr:uncharacterized protein AWJ20_2677 [Sugiyamaella lignohabitans]ANB15057.1 hypothetical protein AWJ20_2677 [Sugiyamaella lignohabitans]